MPRYTPGTRVLNDHLPIHPGVVETVSPSGVHKVRVDKEVGHFTTHVLICDDEVISEAEYEIQEAERYVRYAKSDHETAKSNLKLARDHEQATRQTLREERTKLRALRRKHDGS